MQILGAEKALFRALKTKGNTPKYGLIFHSSFIGRASQKNKVRKKIAKEMIQSGLEKKLFVDHCRRTSGQTARLVVAKKPCDYTPRALPRVFVAGSLPTALSFFFFHSSSLVLLKREKRGKRS